jgi:hypothetical protein
MQCTLFRANSAKNDLKPTDFLKRNFYFETDGVTPQNHVHFGDHKHDITEFRVLYV